jgi:DNA-binding MarR family transcriptional regulator
MVIMKAHQLYLRFLNVLHTLENEQAFPTLDPDARRLLEEIAMREESGQSLTVTEAMGLSHIASPATLHRKLDILRQTGLIKHKFEGDNRRTKHVVCTPLAVKFFDRAGRALQRSLKTS